jgi:acyl carrier protein
VARQVYDLEKLRCIDEVLELPLGSVSGDEHLSELEAWDSVAVIRYLAMADERFHVFIEAHKVAECKTVVDLIALLT